MTAAYWFWCQSCIAVIAAGKYRIWKNPTKFENFFFFKATRIPCRRHLMTVKPNGYFYVDIMLLLWMLLMLLLTAKPMYVWNVRPFVQHICICSLWHGEDVIIFYKGRRKMKKKAMLMACSARVAWRVVMWVRCVNLLELFFSCFLFLFLNFKRVSLVFLNNVNTGSVFAFKYSKSSTCRLTTIYVDIFTLQ